MLEAAILALVFCAYVVRNELQLRSLRRDLLAVAKNPRQARNDLKTRRSYKKLD